jgi:hypothetical protein
LVYWKSYSNFLLQRVLDDFPRVTDLGSKIVFTPAPENFHRFSSIRADESTIYLVIQEANHIASSFLTLGRGIYGHILLSSDLLVTIRPA